MEVTSETAMTSAYLLTRNCLILLASRTDDSRVAFVTWAKMELIIAYWMMSAGKTTRRAGSAPAWYAELKTNGRVIPPAVLMGLKNHERILSPKMRAKKNVPNR